MNHLEYILALSKKRINYFHDNENIKNWYRGSETYFEGILTETQEAKQENVEKNHIYLEDELGDIFWNFCCLLQSLKRENKISDASEVFRRCAWKFSERIGENADGWHDWENIKIQQKARRKAEHKAFYNNQKPEK